MIRLINAVNIANQPSQRRSENGLSYSFDQWIPAFAGMTNQEKKL